MISTYNPHSTFTQPSSNRLESFHNKELNFLSSASSISKLPGDKFLMHETFFLLETWGRPSSFDYEPDVSDVSVVLSTGESLELILRLTPAHRIRLSFPYTSKHIHLSGFYRRSWYFHAPKTQIHASTPFIYGVLEDILMVLRQKSCKRKCSLSI